MGMATLNTLNPKLLNKTGNKMQTDYKTKTQELINEYSQKLEKINHRKQLVQGELLTIISTQGFKRPSTIQFGYTDDSTIRCTDLDTGRFDEEHLISYYEDNENTIIFKGVFHYDTVLNGFLIKNDNDTFTCSNITVKYKSYKESLDNFEFSRYLNNRFQEHLKSISVAAKTFYEDSLNGIVPEVHIIEESEVVIEDEKLELNSHTDIIKEYHSVVSEISEASRQINQNTKLEDLTDITEAFMNTREKLKELSTATVTKTASIFDRLKGVPLLGKAITATSDLKAKTDSVQDNIDALFININKQYNRLVEIGEGLQKAKHKQESQMGKLEALIKASDSFMSKYTNPVDVPMKELSANNQIKISYEKLKKRILKTEAAIMGTQASIVSLGKNLPTSKAEMTEELALSGLLNSVTSYQEMYSGITQLLNDVVEVTSEKTYKVVENLMELQIQDTHTLNYLSKDSTRAKQFAMMLTDKSQKLADKVRNDANLVKEIANGSSILEARAKVKSLGYN